MLVFAQITEEQISKAADCKHAIDITGKKEFHLNQSPEGYGAIMDISSSNSKDIFYFEKEHYTIWYKFTIQKPQLLEFDIIPDAMKDDYDFLLFKKSGTDFCESIKNKKVKPVRTNISRNDSTIGSKTGLKKGAQDLFVHSGPGPAYSEAVYVREGDEYYLVLDNVYGNGKGHLLRFNTTGYDIAKAVPPKAEPPIERPVPEPVAPQPEKVVESKYKYVAFLVKDSATNATMDAEITITRLQRKIAEFQQKADKEKLVEIEPESKYNIEIYSVGYQTTSTELMLPHNQGSDTILHEVLLSRLKTGEKISLRNINFTGNTPWVLQQSYPAMDALLNFMKKNPEVEIELGGHTSGCLGAGKKMYVGLDGKNHGNCKKLSNERAISVKNYLVNNGVDDKRVETKGYADSQPAYQSEALNRRVEVTILSE